MPKKIFKRLKENFCVYLLVAANLIYAVKNNCFDWLLWLSIGLCILSVVFCFIFAYGGNEK